MVGTLYLVSAPVGTPRDLTRRSLQVLRSAALVLADDEQSVLRLLAQLDLAASPIAGRVEVALEALKQGDVAFLSSGWRLGLSEPGKRLVRTAIQRGSAVVPIPGTVFPLTALILSGLPAHSFVWIDEPLPRSAGQSLLASLRDDPRTAIALASASNLVEVSAEIYSSLGNRMLVLAVPSDLGAEVVWRGTLDEVAESAALQRVSGRCVLIIGGSQEIAPRWDENRLRAHVERLRARGMGAREISQQLAESSGWPRREIYRMVVEAGRPDNHHTP